MTNIYALILISVEYHAFELNMHQYFRADDPVGDGQFGVRLPGPKVREGNICSARGQFAFYPVRREFAF